MTEFCKQLSKAMDIRGIKQNELCNLTGIPKSAMSQYVSGKFKPKQTRTYLIAKALNVSESWLMGCDDVPMDREKNLTDSSTYLTEANIFLRPVLNDKNAIILENTASYISGYLPTYIPDPSLAGNYIWIYVTDDSMAPLIDKDSRILLIKQDAVKSGEIAAVLIDHKNVEIKRFIKNDDNIELQSVNPYYPPRKFRNADMDRVHILGIIKKVCKTL